MLEVAWKILGRSSKGLIIGNGGVGEFVALSLQMADKILKSALDIDPRVGLERAPEGKVERAVTVSFQFALLLVGGREG